MCQRERWRKKTKKREKKKKKWKNNLVEWKKTPIYKALNKRKLGKQITNKIKEVPKLTIKISNL